jgi:alpha-glucuronidase
MQKEWLGVKGLVDDERFEKVKTLLAEQEENAKVWRDACLLYFQTFSGRPIPTGYEQPEHDLDYYKRLKYSF